MLGCQVRSVNIILKYVRTDGAILDIVRLVCAM
jgi:hypothetical protein